MYVAEIQRIERLDPAIAEEKSASQEQQQRESQGVEPLHRHTLLSRLIDIVREYVALQVHRMSSQIEFRVQIKRKLVPSPSGSDEAPSMKRSRGPETILSGTPAAAPPPAEKLQKLEMELSKLKEEISRLMQEKQLQLQLPLPQGGLPPAAGPVPVLGLPHPHPHAQPQQPPGSASSTPPLPSRAAPPPPPPPPPPAAATAAEAAAERAANEGAARLQRAHVVTRRRAAAGPASLSELLSGGSAGLLRHVEGPARSPGGTPRREREREPADPALILALALKKKFRHAAQSSPPPPSSPSPVDPSEWDDPAASPACTAATPRTPSRPLGGERSAAYSEGAKENVEQAQAQAAPQEALASPQQQRCERRAQSPRAEATLACSADPPAPSSPAPERQLSVRELRKRLQDSLPIAAPHTPPRNPGHPRQPRAPSTPSAIARRV